MLHVNSNAAADHIDSITCHVRHLEARACHMQRNLRLYYDYTRHALRQNSTAVFSAACD
jgi:hypothetical protein